MSDVTVRSSFRQALIGIFGTVAETGGAAQETVGMATNYVHNRAVEQRLTDRAFIRHRTAETLRDIQKKLDADADLSALYDKLESEF